MNTDVVLVVVGLVALASLAVGLRVLWLNNKTKREAHQHSLNLDEDEAMLTGGHVNTTEKLQGRPALRLGHLLADSSRTVVSLSMQACMVYGPAGAGKTTMSLVENIIAWPSEAFLCVSTTKADLAQTTIRARTAEPGPTVVFDPSGLVDTLAIGSDGLPQFDAVRERVQTWTPVAACTGWDASLGVAEAIIAATSKDDSQHGDFWETQVKVLLAVSMMIQRNERSQPGSIRGADRWIMDLAQSASKQKQSDEEVIETALEQLQGFISAHANTLGSGGEQTPRAAHLEREYRAAQEQVEKVSHTLSAEDTAAGIVGNVTNVTVEFSRVGNIYGIPWHDESVMDVETLVRTPGATVYSITGEKHMRSIATAFIGEIVKQLRRYANEHRDQGLPVPALMCLDELVNASPHPELGYWLSEMFRQNRIKALLATQSRKQLEKVYGKDDATVIEDNVGEMLLLGGSKNIELLEWASKIAGDKVIMVKNKSLTKTKSENFDGVSPVATSRSNSKATGWSEQRVERKMVSVARLFNMPEGQGLAMIPRRGVAHVGLTPFYEDPALTKACEGDAEAVKHVQTRVKKTGWKADKPV